MEEAESLDALALRALEWTADHRSRFRLPDDVTDPGHDVDATLKPLGELARIGVSLRRDSAPETATKRIADDLIDFAWHEFRQGELFMDLLRSAPSTTYPLEFYAPFTEVGLRHHDFEDFAHCMAATRNWAVIELEPTRALGVVNAQRCLGIPPGHDVETMTRRTWLGGLPEPWAIESFAAYALTHGVFHLTNWGDHGARLSGEITDYLELWLPVWLATWLEEENWDLCGELLVVDALLPDAEPSNEPWRRLAAAQEADGAIPESGREAPPRGDRFLGCYHSTLVGAFAATSTTARNRARDVPPVTTARPR